MYRRLISHRSSGETLIEIVIAISVLTTVLASAFTVLVQVSATNGNSLNRVIALNLAREGIESVRNIRDTNWLKYSGDRREKWLCFDTVGTPNACEGDENISLPAGPGMYRVEFSDAAGRYFLEEVTEVLHEKESLPAEDFRLYQTAAGRLSHEDVSNKALPFYRQIQLTPEEEYLNPSCVTDGDPSCPKDVRLNVLVRVQWMDGKRVRALDLETYLYDFFGRDSY